MSFLRLLAVGKSLIGLKSAPTPYKMVEENLLPKFGEPLAPGKTSGIPVGKKPNLALPTVLAPTASEIPTVPPARKSNLLIASLANRSAQKSARRLVQAELSLGQLQVVRNDLQDSDLEVITPKKMRAAAKTLAIS